MGVEKRYSPRSGLSANHEYNPTLWFIYCEVLLMITRLYLWQYLDNAVVGNWIPNTISSECIANFEIEATEYDKGKTNCAISGFNTFSGVKISLEENFYDKVYKFNFYLRLLGLLLLRYFRYSKVLQLLYCISSRLYKWLRVVTNLEPCPPPPQQPQASARPATVLLLPFSSHSSFCLFFI